MTSTFENRTALVTGGGSGIGYAIAAMLTAAGATVALSDIDAQRAAEAADSLPNSLALGCDVARADDVEAAVAATVAHYGRLDILINNAGMEVTAPLAETTDEQFRRLLEVNVAGVFNGIKYASSALAASGGGAIVSTASAAGWRGVPLMGAYAATKAAVISLTQTAALELRPQNIRVNCVCPGLVDTPMLHGMKQRFGEYSPVAVEDLITAKQGRVGVPDDIARAVTYLASESADFVTGVALPVDNALAASLF